MVGLTSPKPSNQMEFPLRDLRRKTSNSFTVQLPRLDHNRNFPAIG